MKPSSTPCGNARTARRLAHPTPRPRNIRSDARHSLSDAHDRKGADGDEPPCSRLQHGTMIAILAVHPPTNSGCRPRHYVQPCRRPIGSPACKRSCSCQTSADSKVWLCNAALLSVSTLQVIAVPASWTIPRLPGMFPLVAADASTTPGGSERAMLNGVYVDSPGKRYFHIAVLYWTGADPLGLRRDHLAELKGTGLLRQDQR
jgi:hypothetical protein